MTQSILAKVFSGVAVKRLKGVEANSHLSNQHEFNGVAALKKLLGLSDRKRIPTQFLWIGEEQEGISENGFLTWYQSRKPPRDEYRLYFKTTAVMSMAKEGDSVFFGSCPDGSMMVIVSPANSTMENQLSWLFGVQDQLELGFIYEEVQKYSRAEGDFAVRYILEELGLEPEEPNTGFLDAMLEQFGEHLPTTKIFSAFARSTLENVSALDDPDAALIAWMEQEEALFRRFERHIVEDRLKTGFFDSNGADADGFLKFSLSVQNRRKSRAGLALENHLEEVFSQKNIRYVRGAMTENRVKPDFLFPGIEEYQNETFPADLLTMLGAKSTCKDRWRQVLPEAERVNIKHLFTLEPGISEHQTTEMQAMKLQLILPKELHTTFKSIQQKWLMSLEEFVVMVNERDEINR